nr:hypothetical protein HmN_000622300 [Hymenolepis microstoma]
MSSIPTEFFNQLRQNGHLIDLHIITKENRKIPTHRLLLCAKFPRIMNKLLQNQGPTMKWHRFSTDLVQSVIDFAYTGKIDIDVANVGQLYLLAHNLGSQSLIDGCRKFIEERFDQINVSEIWTVSSILGKHDLREQCILKIACDFDSFVKDKKCLRWTTAKDMEALLSSPWLWAPSEDARLKALVSWTNATPSSCEWKNRDGLFPHLLSTLNVNKLSRSLIVEVAMGESDIILSDDSRHAVLDYWIKRDKSDKRRMRERIFFCGHHEETGSYFLSPAPHVKGIEAVFKLPSRNYSCIVACDEYIYVIGGMTKEMISSACAFTIDPCNDEVKETKSMTQSRSFASAVTVEHEILVFGGLDTTAVNDVLTTCEKYSPLDDKWVTLPNMPTGRFRSGAVHVPDVGVLVLGGRAEKCGNALKTVELFQSSANHPTWCSFTPMLQPRLSPAVEFFNGCVYVAGSSSTRTQSVEFLSISDGVPSQWTLVSQSLHIDSRLFSMLAVSNHLYVGMQDVYELETPHEENDMNRTDYSWKLRFRVQTGQNVRLLKVLVNV